MKHRMAANIVSWLAGLGILALIILLVRDLELSLVLSFFTHAVVLPWLALALLARLLIVEILARPILALGYPVSRMALFWLSWLRSFANQFIPVSGVALVAGYCKRVCGLNWGEISALSSPLMLLSMATSGTLLTGAVIINHAFFGWYAWPLAVAAILATTMVTALIMNGPRLLAWLPVRLHRRLGTLERALRIFAGHRQLMARLVLFYGLLIMLRGLQLWLLFALGTDLSLSLPEIILLIAISEISFLVPFFPGGIGIREGALVATALLLGLNIETVALVALINRFFGVGIVAFMALPAYLMLNKSITPISPYE